MSITTTTDVLTAIVGHHAELQQAVSQRVDAVVAAARDGAPHADVVAELRALLATEVVPHARAEEEVIYAAATQPALQTLVAGMIFEHETLLDLADRLAGAPTAADAASIAGGIRAVFDGHVRRENDLLLPALASDPAVDLVALLPTMHERFSAYRSTARGGAS